MGQLVLVGDAEDVTYRGAYRLGRIHSLHPHIRKYAWKWSNFALFFAVLEIIFSRFCTVANYVIAPNYMLFILDFCYLAVGRIFFTIEDFAVFLFYFTFPGYF